jgi:hypothetical protein
MIERKNECRQGAIAACISIVALAGGIICGKALDYRDTFIPGTIINGHEVTAMTVSEVEEVLGDYQLKVSFRDGEPLTIAGEDIDYHYVSDGHVEQLLHEQSPYAWVLGLYKNTRYEIPEKKEFSAEKLLAIFHAVPQMQSANMIAPRDAFVDYQDGKFLVAPEVDGTTLDQKAADAAVREAVLIEKETLHLEDTKGAYLAPKVRKENERLIKDVEQLNDLAGARIVYDLPGGDTRVLDGTELKDWLEVDDEGDYYRDDDIWEECLTAFVQDLADQVDTVYKEHPFTTHSGDEIMLPGKGYYGYRIDKTNEAEELRWELDDNEQTEREPVYWRTEASDPDDNHGFGGDYVEVDLSQQHLWIYKDHNVIFETDIVSGNNDSEHRTPAGAFFAYDKKRDTTLRGDKQDDGEWGYETDVDYWIRLTDTGIGLHDASWRYYFGGNIWNWNGSHGCINCPTWAMPTIFELVEQNMPVAVHYGTTQ